MIKLIIFDLDGTLLDTLKDIEVSCNYALAACGCPSRTTDEYRRFVGRGIMNLFREALPEGRKDEDTLLQMRRHFVAYYNEHLCDFTRPYPGIPELINSLEKAGIKLAIASNKYQEGTERLISSNFNEKTFYSILGQREGKPIKPDPDIIMETIANTEGATLENTIYCGDSDIDMQTGANAGVRTIGVTWGFRSREELERYNPWLLADSPEQICSAIMQIMN